MLSLDAFTHFIPLVGCLILQAINPNPDMGWEGGHICPLFVVGIKKMAADESPRQLSKFLFFGLFCFSLVFNHIKGYFFGYGEIHLKHEGECTFLDQGQSALSTRRYFRAVSPRYILAEPCQYNS